MMWPNYAGILMVMLIAIGHFKSVDNSKCFQCRSDVNKHCDELKDKVYLLECETTEPKTNASAVSRAVNITATHRKTNCRKVSQHFSFINSTIRNIVTRECSKSSIKENDCYWVANELYKMDVCECTSDACNGTNECRTICWFLLFFLCLRIIFPP